ncbi:MAG TPA: hypothetical protein VGH71_07845, partial [Gammaproteobacteria bacterium]
MSELIPAAWIQGLSPGEFALSLLAAWGGCLLAFFMGWRFQRRLRIIAETPKSLIRSAAQGYVELQGIARLMPGPPIVAPLTGKRCVWWSYRIERRSRS